MQDHKQQPEAQAQPEQQAYGPAPVSQQAPYQQQPVNQQYFAQPQAAPVQYVVMAESLKGVKGWLLFFTVCFALSGISYIYSFFMSMVVMDGASSIITLIFAPILAIAFLTTVVFIALEKSLGKWLAVGTLGFGALYGVVSNIVLLAQSGASVGVPLIISSIIVGLVIQGLLILYFFASRRVKETLVK
jgi:hypothetical protein